MAKNSSVGACEEDFLNEFACYVWGWIIGEIKTWQKIYGNYHKLKDGVNGSVSDSSKGRWDERWGSSPR